MFRLNLPTAFHLLGTFWISRNVLMKNLVCCLMLQLANNTLERVAPLTHAVGNVLKRVFVIGFSIIVFGE